MSIFNYSNYTYSQYMTMFLARYPDASIGDEVDTFIMHKGRKIKITITLLTDEEFVEKRDLLFVLEVELDGLWNEYSGYKQAGDQEAAFKKLLEFGKVDSKVFPLQLELLL